MLTALGGAALGAGVGDHGDRRRADQQLSRFHTYLPWWPARGFGQPEAASLVRRLLDALDRDIGDDVGGVVLCLRLVLRGLALAVVGLELHLRAYVGGDPDTRVVKERLEGYQQAMAEFEQVGSLSGLLRARFSYAQALAQQGDDATEALAQTVRQEAAIIGLHL